MARKKRYYGVYAANGFGVYTDSDKMEDAQTYMVEERIKRFADRDDAEDFALIGFESLYGVDCRLQAFPEVVDSLRLNWFYYYR